MWSSQVFRQRSAEGQLICRSRPAAGGAFYLLSGPSGAGKRTLARLLAAALLCRDPHRRPCGRCGPCRKVLAGTHPDFITVDDPDRKTVSVETVRRAREDLFIRPNEGDRKNLLCAQSPGPGPSRAERSIKGPGGPPAYGVFLLLADNPDRLLPTVRSRCVGCGSSRCRVHSGGGIGKTSLKLAVRRWPLRPGAAEAGWAGQGGCCRTAPGYPDRGIHKPSVGGTTSACFRSWPPWEAEAGAVGPILSQWRDLLTIALTCRSGLPGRTPLGKSAGLQPHLPGAVPKGWLCWTVP